MTVERIKTLPGPNRPAAETQAAPTPESGIHTQVASRSEHSAVMDAVLDEQMTPKQGDVLGDRYLLKAMIGQGGMGWVFRATDLSLGRTVAVKILFPSLARNQEIFGRFTREARSMAGLDHPNVVPVFDVGTQELWHYFVMKYLPGETLHRHLDDGPLPQKEAIEIATDILDGLEHMHSRGVIHRDIKPSNIVLTSEGRAVILDFGILRIDSETRVTRAGLFMGTPEYVAPELVRSAPGDARTDLYSLGITLFEMLTARLPFQGASPLETVSAQLRDMPKMPSALQPGIVPELDGIVLHALAKEPDERFQSASEMRAALRAVSLPAPPAERPMPPTPRELVSSATPASTRPQSTLILALAAVILIAAGLGLWAGTRPRAPRVRKVAATAAPEERRPQPIVTPARAAPRQPTPAPAPVEAALPTLVTAPAAEPPPVPEPPPVAESPRPTKRRAEPPPAAAGAPDRRTTPVTAPASPTPGARPEPATGSALERARSALRAGDGASAVRLFLEASRQSPGSAAPFRGLGDAYLSIGNRTAAIGAYRRYLVLNPNARDAEAVREKLRRLGAG